MERSIRKWFIVFMAPTIITFLIAFLVPFLMGLYLSFCDFRSVTDAQFVGFSNYIRLVTENKEFLNSLKFTATFTVVSVVTVNFFAFLLALSLTRGLRGTNIFRTVFFMPNLIGGIVLGYIWQVLINGILYNYGYSITSKAEFGFFGLVIIMNWQMIGYMMVIYIAGIQNIPDELIEAASVDGASRFGILKNIILPSVMPSFTICLFLTLTNSFKLFDQNLALTAGAPANKTRMLALDIYNTFYGRVGNEGLGQAKAVIFSIIVALIALLQLYITRSREEEG